MSSASLISMNASNSRSSFIEPLSHESEVQNDYDQASRSQIRSEDWFVTIDRSERYLLPYIHSSSTQEVPKVCFWGQNISMSNSSFRSGTLTPHFHEVYRCCSGSLVVTHYKQRDLHNNIAFFK